MDSDVLNVVVAIVVIYGVVRWWSKPANPATATGTPRGPSLGFRPHNVSPAMIESVISAFPQEPRANVHYDLLRTGNAQVTSNTLIEKGFLPPAPAAFFTLYPQPNQPPPSSTAPSNASSGGKIGAPSKTQSLIERYGLESRVSENSVTTLLSDPVVATGAAAGKSAWLDSAAKREDSLKERKAQMVLAARQRMLSKQAKGKGKAVDA